MTLKQEMIPISAVVYLIRSEGYEISVSQINKLIRLGIIEKPETKEGKRALFTKDIIEKIKEALHYRLLGASLAEIKEVFTLKETLKRASMLRKEDEYGDKQQTLSELLLSLAERNKKLLTNSEKIIGSIVRDLRCLCHKKSPAKIASL